MTHTVTFHNVSEPEFQSVADAVARAGFGQMGTTSLAPLDLGHGFTATYSYVPNGDLTIKLDGSWLLMSLAVNKLTGYIRPFLRS